MAETEVQDDTPTPPPQFELEKSDEYSRFLLHSKSEILSVLRTLIQKGSMITVHFDQGHAFLLTSMIALTPDNREFIIDLGSNEEMNQKALLTKKLIFTTLIDKVKIQFSLGKISLTQHEGRPAFLGAIPQSVLRLQRRDFFRLSTPVANPITLVANLELADQPPRLFELPVLDISGGGVGLMASPEQARIFNRGDIMNDCRMMLPEEGLLVVTLSVRNMFDVITRTGARHVRIGCEYVGLPSVRMTMVQRYITRIERERKARLSGMA